MSNNLHSILAGAFLDQLCEKSTEHTDTLNGLCVNMLQGSMFNPLQTMRLLTIDLEQGSDYGSEKLVEATGGACQVV